MRPLEISRSKIKPLGKKTSAFLGQYLNNPEVRARLQIEESQRSNAEALVRTIALGVQRALSCIIGTGSAQAEISPGSAR